VRQSANWVLRLHARVLRRVHVRARFATPALRQAAAARPRPVRLRPRRKVPACGAERGPWAVVAPVALEGAADT